MKFVRSDGNVVFDLKGILGTFLNNVRVEGSFGGRLACVYSFMCRDMFVCVWCRSEVNIRIIPQELHTLISLVGVWDSRISVCRLTTESQGAALCLLSCWDSMCAP